MFVEKMEIQTAQLVDRTAVVAFVVNLMLYLMLFVEVVVQHAFVEYLGLFVEVVVEYLMLFVEVVVQHAFVEYLWLFAGFV